MNKVSVFITWVLMFGSAFGANENIPTSKTYVDTELAVKQDKITANNGAAQVLTNTGTAGEYGTKGIYDSTGTYSTQSDGLVDAVTMNAAVQNAIDSEFQCVEYNPNDPTDCWLMDVRGETGLHTINLLDESFMDFDTYGSNTVYGYTLNNSRILPTENGKTYTLSAKLSHPSATHGYFYYISEVFPDGTAGYPTGGQWMWACDSGRYNCERTDKDVKFTFTTRDNAIYLVYIAGGPNVVSLQKQELTLSEYQMEEGSTATPYQPYNLYLPAAQ